MHEPQSHPTPVLKLVIVTSVPPQAQSGFEQRKSIYEAIQTLRLGCASAALAHYNEQHGTDYKLVYALECNKFVPHGDMIHWYHCNFLAAVPEPPYDGGDSFYMKLTDDDSSSAKLFFTELNYPTSTHPVITACYILDGADQIQHGCLTCRGVLAHPTSGLQKGVGKRDLFFGTPK